MNYRGDTQKTALIEEVAATARNGRADAEATAVDAFVRQYYAHVAPEDLADRSIEALQRGALSLWEHMQSRKPGKAKVRAYTPTQKKHGWQADRTIVEIVNDDMPFLVDSVTAELNQRGIALLLLIHPVVRVRRDRAGRLTGILAEDERDENAVAESVMHIEIAEQPLPETVQAIRDGLERVLDDVRAAVTDWRAMRVRIADVIAELDSQPPPLPADELQESKAFLRWVEDNHFTFLGCREYGFADDNGRPRLTTVAKSGLGVLRRDDVRLYGDMIERPLPQGVLEFMQKPKLLIVSKANAVATVHRRAPLDTIAIKRYDAQGRVVGGRVFAGLFTSTVINQDVRQIPLLRRKADAVMKRARFAPNSHDGKALLHILESLPREELFQIDDEALYDICMGILHLQERQRTALFVHRDPFGRFASCLVYIPQDRYNARLRERIQAIVEDGFGGRVTGQFAQIGDSSLARLHFVVALVPDAPPPSSDEAIEARLIEASRDWTDDLSHELAARHGNSRGAAHLRKYAGAFPPGYRDRYGARSAVHDIARIEDALAGARLSVELYCDSATADNALHAKIYNPGGPVPLSDVLPVFENMGLKVLHEQPYEVTPADGPRVWIHDFAVVRRSGKPVVVEEVKDEFHDAFARVWSGEMENDGFNRLVIGAGLPWRRVVVLRAYCKWLLQAGIPFSQAYMEQTLAANAGIAARVADLFEAMFDPAAQQGAAARIARIRADIDERLNTVTNLDEDRILRRFLNAVDATLRTNFFQPAADGTPKPYLSVKIDSRKIDDLPLPRPMVEIFVYSPRMEGVHLRGGKVARGGIRWSDRREDFRTEILGLMKAQMTKNAVIVPVGAKGGFVLKRPPADGGREAMQAEGVACYQILIRGMLDLTDNRTPDALVPPPDVVRRDDDDPYLVVAADKGTATFSDIANALAAEYGFWLDDAFASGGSAGYDHKKMGITARGAWESVKRHFRELGIDVQSQDFTCVGVGDMAGDVFGNGMLQSRHTRLIAAFNHLHVFIDPDPDPAASFAERQRLFDLPRSSWADYDRKLISAGGGVFERSAKSIPVTPQMRALFDLPDGDTITPPALIRALVGARVDLLFFGGIGTFVKASDEAHAEVGDRANDPLRLDGRALRCKVVGEGANLGVTQRGRIEAALAGTRLNTDFIDNSAGVDTSDHEVNIKILLGEAMASGALTRPERDTLMTRMTDDVAALVLMDNYRQTMAITQAESQGVAMLDELSRYMRVLERAGKLNRAVEFLPDDEAIAERRNLRKGLTRPELAVVLAYGKMDVYGELLESDLPDEPYLAQDVGLYFPAALRARFADAIPRHRLRREIVATYVTNSLVNRMGAAFVREVGELTGRTAPEVVRAYLIARHVFRARALWAAIEGLDNKVAAEVQNRLNIAVTALLRHGTLWFLRNGARPLDVTRTIAVYAGGVAALDDALADVLPPARAARLAAGAARLREAGVPEDVAARFAGLDDLASAPDVVRIAGLNGHDVTAAGRAYFTVGTRFGLGWLRESAEAIVPETAWQAMALTALTDDLYAAQSELTARIVAEAGGPHDVDKVIAAWQAADGHPIRRVDSLIEELHGTPALDLSMIMVAAREIRAMIGG